MIQSTKAIRIQRKCTKGWKMPPNTLYVGRGSKWENPFRVVQYHDKKWAIKTDGSERYTTILINNTHATYNTKEDATKDAIKCYALSLTPYTHDNGDNLIDFYLSIAQVEHISYYLKGKNLACWCGINEMCHADILLDIANK